MIPALTSSSLNLPMSANCFSLGMIPASEFFDAFTITMTRIAVSFRWSRPGDERATAGSTATFEKEFCQRWHDKCNPDGRGPTEMLARPRARALLLLRGRGVMLGKTIHGN